MDLKEGKGHDDWFLTSYGTNMIGFDIAEW